MTVFADDIAGALEDIRDNGELCKWRSFGDPVGSNPAKPSARTYTEYEVYIVILPDTKGSLRNEDGTEVRGGFMYGLMGQVPFTPDIGDLVYRANGEELRIRPDRGIDILDPAGDAILYTIYFAR